MPGWLESLLTGVAGGVALALVVYGARIPFEVRNHDRLIRDRGEDLSTWVSDTKPALDWRLIQIAAGLAARGMLQSGELNWMRARAKEQTLHAYRDQERAAERFIAEIELRDTWAHRVYRFFAARPQPSLSAPETTERVLDSWREDAEPGRPANREGDRPDATHARRRSGRDQRRA